MVQLPRITIANFYKLTSVYLQVTTGLCPKCLSCYCIGNVNPLVQSPLVIDISFYFGVYINDKQEV